MRLFYFQITQGNKIGLQYLVNEMGWIKAIPLIFKLKLRLLTNNPFKEINRRKPPSKQEKSTQKQMAPLIVLYFLLEHIYPRARTMRILSELSQKIAIAFLKYNVPTLHAESFSDWPKKEKLANIKNITRKFFNAKAELKLDSQDNIRFTVNVCYFARYAKMLNVPELAPLFCAADKLYFETYQPEVKLIRTVTLANDDLPCDFYFQWRNHGIHNQEDEDATMRTVF